MGLTWKRNIKAALLIPDSSAELNFWESRESVWSCNSGASGLMSSKVELVQGVWQGMWQGMWQVWNWPRFVSKVTWVLWDVTVNWGLNVFPLLGPALQSSYMKIWGKTNAHASLCLTEISSKTSHGSWTQWNLLQVSYWIPGMAPDDADLTICCNVCLHGLGFMPHLTMQHIMPNSQTSYLYTWYLIMKLSASY